MIDQAIFARILRRLYTFDRDDFVEMSRCIGPPLQINEWYIYQADPAGYFLSCGAQLQSEIFKILVKKEQVQELTEE